MQVKEVKWIALICNNYKWWDRSKRINSRWCKWLCSRRRAGIRSGLISVVCKIRLPCNNTATLLMVIRWGTIQDKCKVTMQMNRRQRLGQKVKLFPRLKKVKAKISGVAIAASKNLKQRKTTLKTPNLTLMTVNQPQRAPNRKGLKYSMSANPVNPIPLV
jgi:hypothetical protein